MSICVGNTFASFADLQDAIKKLEFETNTIFVREEANKTKVPALTETLVYDRVLFACKQGRIRKPRGKGERTLQRSVKLGCTARIRVVVKDVHDEWKLVVTIANLDHDTHSPVKETLAVFPETRKITVTPAMQMIVKNCPSISAKDLMKLVEDDQGKKVLPRDVHNFRARCKGNGSADPSQVEVLLKNLKDDGGSADFGVDPSGSFRYLSFQTRQMALMCQQYPEVLIMDITYKVNIYRLPLLTIMCIDNNGKGHPIFHSFLATEEQGVLVKALEMFEASFDSTKTSCFFVDKDFSEIGALSTVFPEKAIIVCAFHIAQAVKKALHKKGLSAQQVDTIKSLFMDIKDALTLEEYETLKGKLLDVCPEPICQYFQSNWFQNPRLWAAHQLVGVGRLHVTTTNHCESYHQKIKHVLTSNLSLSDCLTKLLRLDMDMFVSASYKNVRNLCTVPITYDADPIIDAISRDLTPFAANLVGEQYRVMMKIPYVVTPSSGDSYSVSYDGHDHLVTVSSCSCSFYVNFDLACRHIFCLRAHLSMVVYQAVPSDHRFKPRVLDSSGVMVGQVSSSLCPSRQLRHTPEGKYTSAKLLADTICSYMSLLGDHDFDEKHVQLSSLFASWTGSAAVVDIASDPISGPLLSDVVDFVAVPGPSVSNAAVSTDPISDPSLLDVDFVAVPGPSVSNAAVSTDPISNPSLLDVDFVAVPGPSVSNAAVSTDPISDPSLSDVVAVSDPSLSPSPESASFGAIVLQPVRVKGRPKNRQTFTTRKRKASTLLSFADLTPERKFRMLLQGAVHLVSDRSVLYSVADIKDAVNISPLLITHDFLLIKECFDSLAWDTLSTRLEQKRIENLFLCSSCNELDDGEMKLIQCECCCCWFHFSCVQYRSHYKVKKWFCPACF